MLLPSPSLSCARRDGAGARAGKRESEGGKEKGRVGRGREMKERVQITVKKAKNAEEPEKMVSESRHESLSFSDREIQLRNLENGRRRKARAILSGRDQFSGVFRMQA